MGLYSLATGNLGGMALAGAGFDWQSIFLNLLAVGGIATIASTVFGIALGPISFALLGLGVGAFQADQTRRELVKAAKKELVKYLPQVAQEQWQPTYSAVQECFDAYEREVMTRIDDDIKARKAELENLLRQKESYEIDRGQELTRLRTLESTVSNECKALEAVYQSVLVS